MFSRVGAISFNAMISHRSFFALDILGSRGEALPLLFGRRHRPKPDWGICGRRRWIETGRGRFHRLAYCRRIAAFSSTDDIGISGCDPAMVFALLGETEFRTTSFGSRRVRSSGQDVGGRCAHGAQTVRRGGARCRDLRSTGPDGMAMMAAVAGNQDPGRDRGA